MCLYVPFSTSAQLGSVSSSSYLDKLTNVEWEIFSESDEVVVAQLLLKKCSIYNESGDYGTAITTLDRINSYLLDDRLQAQIMNERISLLYLNGEFEQAKNTLLELNVLDFPKNDDSRLIEILNSIALKDIDQAKMDYEQLNPSANISEVFDAKKFRKSEKAFNLSLLLPGSGQMYSGYVFKGIASLGVQSFLFTYGVKGIKRRYFFTEALPSIAIFQGFYFGGAEYARELTKERNQKIVRKLSEQVVNSF